MRALILLALCAFAFASFDQQRQTRFPRADDQWLNEIIDLNERQIEEQSFRAQKEYRYAYNGQLCSGIPHSSKQHACTRVQALVSLVFKDSEQMLMQLTHFRVGQLNRHIPNPRQIQPFQAFEEAEMTEELEQRLRLPVQCKYQSGMIRDIKFDGDEQPWSANLKRGVLNMLQVNLKQHKRTDLAEEQLLTNQPQEPLDRQNDFFTCKENTIEGECETFYTITKQPSFRQWNANVMNVTKTINFEKCERRPDIRYNQRFNQPCPTCDRKFQNNEKILESSTVARYNISGTPEQFLIEKAVVESHYMFAPVNEQTDIIATYVNQTLMLVKAGEQVTRVPELNNPQRSDSQMIYSLDWDIQKEQFFMHGDQQFLQNTPYSEIKNKVQMAKQIVQRLIAGAQDEKEPLSEDAPRQVARLVKILRMCTEQELQQIHQKIYLDLEEIPQQHQQMVKDILVDAQGLAATKNTIKHLVNMIKNKQVNPIRGAMALKALVKSRVVSEQQIDMVMDLCKSQVSKRSPVLKQSCLLTVGSMINALCKPNQDQLASEFKQTPEQLCPRNVQKKYTQILEELFDEAETQYEKVLALKTIANAGQPLTVFKLEKIIRNFEKQEQNIVRMQAIDALRQIRQTMPRKVQKVLMPVFKNKWEQCEVRMTAVYQIIQTLPEKPVLDQIAQQLMQERCQQVVNFVQTMLSSYANSTLTCEKQMAEDLQLSLRHAQASRLTRQLGQSRFHHLTYYNQKLNFGSQLNLAAIFANDSYLPKELMLSLDQIVGGHWWKNLIQVGAQQQNGEQIFEQLLGSQGLLYEKSFSEIFTRAKRAVAEPKSLLRQIYQKLGIQGRRSQEQLPSALFYVRFMDHDYAIIPFDQETLPQTLRQMAQEQQLNIENVQKLLAQGYHLDMHTAAFVHECQRKIPTSLGVPLFVGMKIPTVAGVKGIVKADFQPKQQIKNVQIQINAKPKIVSTSVIKVESWTPIVNTGIKLVRTAQINIPINGKAKLNMEQPSQPELELEMEVPQQEIKLVKLDARPVTYTRQWPQFIRTYQEPIEKTIFGEEWNRIQKVNMELGKNELGVAFEARGQWHRTPWQAAAGTPLGAFAGHNFFQITCKPGYQAPTKVVLKANAELFRAQDDSFELQPQEFENFYNTEQEQRLFEQDFFQQEKSQEHKRKHFHHFHQYAQNYRGEKTMQHRVQMLVQTEGGKQRKAELVAKCNCDQTMRLCKWQMEMMRTPIPAGRFQESQPWELKAEGQILYPEVPYTLKQLKEQQHFNKNNAALQVKCEWGNGERKQQYVNMKVEAGQTKEQKTLQRQTLYNLAYRQQHQSDVFSPVMQYDQLLQQAMLTQYKIHCDYEVNPMIQNITNKLYRAFKYYNYYNAQIDQISAKNPQNQIQAVIELDARSHQYVNVTARMPRENLRLQDMALPVPVKPLNTRRSVSPIRSLTQLVQSYTGQFVQQPKCVVSSKRIETFDQVKYRVPLTTCYSVLAKDCSGYDNEQPKFAVLIKKIQQDKEAKKVKIISRENVIELEAVERDFDFEQQQPVIVKVNGQRVQLTQQQKHKEIIKHNHVICRVEKVGPYVKVWLPEEGVKVYFDGFTAAIKTSSLYTNAQCGLCGHYDGEQVEEYRNPQNEFLQNIQDFHKSYFHQDDECEIQQQIVDDEEQYKYEPFQWEDEEWQKQVELKQRFDSRQTSSSEESSEEQESGSWWGFNKIQSREQDQDDHFQQLYSSEYRQSEWTPRMQTKVLELTNEICFSLQPVPTCPHNTYPSQQQMKPKKVAFGCVSRSSSEAQSLRQIVQKQGKVLDTDSQQLLQSMVDIVQVPKMCKQF